MTGEGRTYIESLGVYLPQAETSSRSRVEGIPTFIKIPLQHFTGIESTRRAAEDEFSVDLACRAIERCLARSAYRAEQIGLVIAANISKYDREGYVFSIEPNTATVIRQRFGFKNALAFDVNNACAGMFTAIQIADCFLHQTDIQAALVVSGEYLSHLSDTAEREIRSLSDPRLACLTLGDAGAAVVLARSANPSVGFWDIRLTTLGEHSGLCVGIPSKQGHGGAIMYTDSTGLLKVGAQEGAVHVSRCLQENDWNWDMVGHWIPHQVSTSATEKAADMVMELLNSRNEAAKLSRGRVIANIAKRGNTASTSHLVALEDHIESGRIRTGERIVFSVVASGLTIGTALYGLDDLPERVRGTRGVEKTESFRARFLDTGRHSVSIASVVSTRGLRGKACGTEELCLKAAEGCLAKGPFGRRDVDLLIFVGVFKEGFMAEPSYASILAKKLFPKRSLSDGKPAILAFDVHHGPAGFLAGCEILRTQFARRQIRGGMVIAAECANGSLSEYSDNGVAEVASAALIVPQGQGEVELRDCDFFSFDQHEECYRADMECAQQAHVIFAVREDYDARLGECIGQALQSYVSRIGRSLADFDEFHFPQRSPMFLDELAQSFGIPRGRIVDATIEGKDLYTSSLSCTLERSLGSRFRGSGKCGLVVCAGPGIQVSCATLYT